MFLCLCLCRVRGRIDFSMPVRKGRIGVMKRTFKGIAASALLIVSATMAAAQSQAPQQWPMMGPGMHGMMGQGMGPGMIGGGMPGMMGSGMQGMMGQGIGTGMMGGCPMTRSGMMGQGMMGMQPGMGMGGMMGSMMQPFADANLAYTKAMLKITDAQETAWTAYAAALKAHNQAMIDLQQKMWTQAGQTMPSTVERMDWHAQLMEAHLDALKALKPATEGLYKVLTPEQQQTANLLLPGMCCMM